MTAAEQIAEAKRLCLSGERLPRGLVTALLAIPTDSAECEALGRAAREAASVLCHDRAYLWGAIGLDFKPCTMNCDFCSLGEAWGVVGQPQELGEAEIIEMVRRYHAQGVRWIVLRTTEFYSLDRLSVLLQSIRRAVPGAYELGLNVGEFDDARAEALAAIGADFIYHALRLREGRDTRFDPALRLKTLRAVQRSPMKLVFLVEPVGVEHTDEEIAERIDTVLDCGAEISGAMVRVPVQGTPLGRYPKLPDRRMAQIIAVIRLACGRFAPDICVHTASECAMQWGANVTVVEQGAIPRDTAPSDTVWNGFTCDMARAWFQNAGYTVHQTPE